MAVNLSDIGALARSIGPRPPGSVQERRASQYVEEQLRQAGIPSTHLPFRTPRSYVPVYLSLFLLISAGVPIAQLSPLLGLVISAAGAVLLALEVIGRPLMSRLFASASSQNVVGLIPPRAARGAEDEPARRVILSAHLDSPRAGTIWRPPLLGMFRPLVIAVFTAALTIPVVLLVYALTGSNTVWLATVPLVAVLLVTIGLLADLELRGRPVPGASNNASGVAVVLGVARALLAERPEHVETWFLFTGAKEAGHVGMNEFLRENRFDPEATYFVNVDNVGAGQVRFAVTEGMLIPTGASPALVSIARQIAMRRIGWEVLPVHYHLPPTDGIVPLRHGYQAITIIACDPSGIPPNWHQVTDTVGSIEHETVRTAARLVHGIVQRLDEEINERSTGPRDLGRASFGGRAS